MTDTNDQPRRADPQVVDAMLAKVKSKSLTRAIFDIMKDGTFYTADGIAEMVGYSKRTVSARINDIKHKMGYQVIGSWYTTGLPHVYKYYIPLKDGEPIPCPRKPKPDGLECWACSDDGGKFKCFLQGRPKPEKSKAGAWYSTCMAVHGHLVDAIFPKSIKPGECKRVVIPVAVILEDD